MNLNFRLFGTIIISTLSLLSSSLFAQLDLDQVIPLDPATRTGTLDNGLRYYIKQNTKPENYAELRLAVNAGSMQEDETQLGLAHFMEHMCFNGTQNFPQADLVNYLESIGMRFGSHLNAYTSFDETVYMLRVPTDETEKFEKGFQILEDWAQYASLEGEEIDKERGVIIEEWRTRLGAQQRMQEESYSKIFYDSRYVNRIPIGDTAIIQNFSYETIRRFYRDWYRPNLMAVVAVGDFDVDQVEAMIKERFAHLTNPADAPERELHPIPDHTETLIALTEDPEAGLNQVNLLYKHPVLPTQNLGHYRRDLIASLASSMLNDRLGELAQAEDAPFTAGGGGYSSLVRTKEAYSVRAIVPNGGYLRGMEALLVEQERIIQHGFTASELDRAKESLLTGLKQSYSERERTNSRRVVMRYVYHFLSDAPAPGIEARLAYAEKLLPTISIEDVNEAFAGFITDENRVVSISGSQAEDNPLPSEEEVLAMLRDIPSRKLSPYADDVVEAPLMADIPEAGSIVERKSLPEIGAEEWTLSNGVKVILKPTDFQKNQIMLQAYSPGGSSLYPDEDYLSASNATDVIQRGGIGPFNYLQLEKYLSNKVVGLSTSIGSRQEGLRGQSSVEDLETLFQLLHLYMTAPKRDSAAFNSMMAQNRAIYANLISNPGLWFQSELVKLLYQDHPRRQALPKVEDLDKIELDRAYEIYRERFADGGDFTFFLVGSFDYPMIEPLIAQYLASLPDLGQEEEPKDLDIPIIKEATAKTFYKGQEPQAQVRLQYNTPGKWKLDRRFQLRSATDVLAITLREALREDKGGVYGVGVNSSAIQGNDAHYRVTVRFTCDPEKVEDLVATVRDEIAKLQKEGPSAQNMEKIKETQRKTYQEGLQSNRFWMNNLIFSYQNELSPTRILEQEEEIDALKAKQVRKAAKRYLKEEYLIQAVLLPEE
ncbi:MAG: insulinase family protein [Bacteroidota bacterium]